MPRTRSEAEKFENRKWSFGFVMRTRLTTQLYQPTAAWKLPQNGFEYQHKQYFQHFLLLCPKNNKIKKRNLSVLTETNKNLPSCSHHNVW